MKKILAFIMISLLITGAGSSAVFAMPLARKIIVLDAGHGGWDSGKVQGEIREKNINLSVAKKLQTFLEQAGATVFITRDCDSELSKCKREDMKERCVIANTSHAHIFVSIHQNAFGKTSVHGAQTFYYDKSGDSGKLATAIQSRLREFVDPENKLKSKSNDSYYVLKKTKMPAVLVECGFLTNPAERKKLTDESYQEKIAWAVYLGIVDYFHT